MATTGTQVFNITMALIDEVNDDGSINSADYIRQAPSIISVLQAEIKKAEDASSTAPAIITDLSSTLDISDYSAISVLPNGVAAQLMIHDDKTLANYFQQRYDELIQKISRKQIATEEEVEDHYGLIYGG